MELHLLTAVSESGQSREELKLDSGIVGLWQWTMELSSAELGGLWSLGGQYSRSEQSSLFNNQYQRFKFQR